MTHRILKSVTLDLLDGPIEEISATEARASAMGATATAELLDIIVQLRQRIEASGDRSVIVIDARLKPETIGKIAHDECIKRGYVGYRIFKGETFTRSKPISGYWPVTKPSTENTILRVMGM